eukprot:6058382-Prymnesium_polylepis.1
MDLAIVVNHALTPPYRTPELRPLVERLRREQTASVPVCQAQIGLVVQVRVEHLCEAIQGNRLRSSRVRIGCHLDVDPRIAAAQECLGFLHVGRSSEYDHCVGCWVNADCFEPALERIAVAVDTAANSLRSRMLRALVCPRGG